MRGKLTDKITELIAKEFTFEKESTITFPAGHKYIYLIDPKTDKVYDFGPGLKVEGNDLGSLFEEVKEAEIKS